MHPRHYNEVGSNTETSLTKAGRRDGDPEWEAQGCLRVGDEASHPYDSDGHPAGRCRLPGHGGQEPPVRDRPPEANPLSEIAAGRPASALTCLLKTSEREGGA